MSVIMIDTLAFEMVPYPDEADFATWNVHLVAVGSVEIAKLHVSPDGRMLFRNHSVHKIRVADKKAFFENKVPTWLHVQPDEVRGFMLDPNATMLALLRQKYTVHDAFINTMLALVLFGSCDTEVLSDKIHLAIGYDEVLKSEYFRHLDDARFSKWMFETRKGALTLTWSAIKAAIEYAQNSAQFHAVSANLLSTLAHKCHVKTHSLVPFREIFGTILTQYWYYRMVISFSLMRFSLSLSSAISEWPLLSYHSTINDHAARLADFLAAQEMNDLLFSNNFSMMKSNQGTVLFYPDKTALYDDKDVGMLSQTLGYLDLDGDKSFAKQIDSLLSASKGEGGLPEWAKNY